MHAFSRGTAAHSIFTGGGRSCRRTPPHSPLRPRSTPRPGDRWRCGHFATAGEAVRVIDFETGEHRPSTITDLYDFYRLADALEHIHHCGQTVVATDIDDITSHDLSIAYAGLAGTSKSFGFSIATARHLDNLVRLFDAALGGDGAFLRRPICTIGHCPVVSPLRFGHDTSEVQVRCAELGLTSDMCVAPQAGATAPGTGRRAGAIGGGNAGGAGAGSSHPQGCPHDVRELGVRVRSSHGRLLGWFRRGSSAHGRCGTACPLLRPAGVRGGGHDRLQGTRLPGRHGKGSDGLRSPAFREATWSTRQRA